MRKRGFGGCSPPWALAFANIPDAATPDCLPFLQDVSHGGPDVHLVLWACDVWRESGACLGGVSSPSCLFIGAPGLFQVSHHPPAAAHHAESRNGWTLRQEIKITSKFRGKYLSIMPLGKASTWVRVGAPGRKAILAGQRRLLVLEPGAWRPGSGTEPGSQLCRSRNFSAVGRIRTERLFRDPLSHRFFVFLAYI